MFKGITGWEIYKRENALKTTKIPIHVLRALFAIENYLILKIIQDQTFMGRDNYL